MRSTRKTRGGMKLTGNPDFGSCPLLNDGCKQLGRKAAGLRTYCNCTGYFHQPSSQSVEFRNCQFQFFAGDAYFFYVDVDSIGVTVKRNTGVSNQQ